MTRTAIRFGLLLSLGLALSPAAGADEALTAAQKQAVEQVVREYLLAHPEVIVEAMRALQAREHAESQARTRETLAARRGELEDDPLAPVVGDPKADVTVVEFFDYQCGYCKQVFPAVQQLLKSDPRIRYVFKEFPILGPESVVAARVALAAWTIDRGRYFSLHTALMEAKGPLTEERILKIAAAAGLEAARLRKAMADPAIEATIQRNLGLAEALGITGTPSFVVGLNVIPGAVDLPTLQKVVATARQRCAAAGTC